MNLLAIDTSTQLTMIAVQRGGSSEPQQWTHTGPGGAQASATLIPAIEALLLQSGLRLDALDAIAFGAGPGSFTGLRTACAVAQGLAFGARARQGAAREMLPALPIDTLMATAEEVRFIPGNHHVTAVLDARMGELYCASYVFDGAAWGPLGPARLMTPVDVLAEHAARQANLAEFVLAGTVFGDPIHESLTKAAHKSLNAWPTALAMLRLAPGLLRRGLAVAAADALPHYVRDKVAQTTAERLAAKAK